MTIAELKGILEKYSDDFEVKLCVPVGKDNDYGITEYLDFCADCLYAEYDGIHEPNKLFLYTREVFI